MGAFNRISKGIFEPAKMTVEEFSKLRGYDSFKYENDWEGYKVYKPIRKELVGVQARTGYPLRILERCGECRMTTPEESLRYSRAWIGGKLKNPFKES